MERTTPVSSGCTTLVRPLGTIFPLADATMSIVPHQAQASVAQNRTTMVAAIARPIGDGGDSTISSAAGRKANSRRRLSGATRAGAGIGFAGRVSSTDILNPRLQP